MIRETWREVGIKRFPKPTQRDVLRNRVFSGEALVSVWSGIENGIAGPEVSPEELAPTSQQQLQWPKFGQFYETSGKAGEAPDIPEVAELLKLNTGLARASARGAHENLAPHACDPRRAAVAIGVVNGCRSRWWCAIRCATCRKRGSTTGIRAISSASTGPRPSGSLSNSCMLTYTIRRLLIMIPTLLVISFVTFSIIKLPPGDFLSNQIAELRSQGDKAALEKVEFLRKQYGLDKPFLEQYAVWVGIWPSERGFSGLLQGDWGWSFEHDLPVSEVIGDRMLLSFMLNFTVVLFTGGVVPDRRLRSHAHHTAGATWPHAARLYRPGDALPVRAGADVLRQRPVRPASAASWIRISRQAWSREGRLGANLDPGIVIGLPVPRR
jgi:hypothetical protein